MKRLAILANRDKPGSEDALKLISAWASSNEVELTTNITADVAGSSPSATGPFGKFGAEELRDMFAGADAIVTLGGDGTLLYAAQIVAPIGLPVLSVNLGSLGFHTQVTTENLIDRLEAVSRGEFKTEPRMLLQATLERLESSFDGGAGTDSKERLIALNDIVVSKSAWGHMVHLRLYVDGQVVTDVSADALIVASPTGSSAYNYAAGGPVLLPGLDNIIINTICAHRMYLSALVLPSTSMIEVTFHPRRTLEDAQVLVDGQPWRTVTRSEVLKISRAAVYLPLIVFEDDFYLKLRDKLRWGGLF